MSKPPFQLPLQKADADVDSLVDNFSALINIARVWPCSVLTLVGALAPWLTNPNPCGFSSSQINDPHVFNSPIILYRHRPCP